MSDPHRVLGIRPGAGPAELRRALHRRALETHPDRGGDPAAFAVVLDAFRRLSGQGTGHRSPPVLVRRLGPPALALRWWRRRVDRVRHPRVV